MKLKVYIGILSLITIFIVTGACWMVDDLKLPTVTMEFLNKIETVEEEELKQNLSFYTESIIKEVELSQHREALQNSYFALGYIESLKGNYEESNQYYYRVLSVNAHQSDSLYEKVYGELAFNAIKQGNIEKGFEYFELALQLNKESKNQMLLNHLYSRYAQALNSVKGHEGYVLNLLESINHQDQEPYQKIQNLRLMSQNYLLSGRYQVSIDYLLEALELSIWNDFESLQQQIRIELGNAYYLNGEDAEAVEILSPCLLNLSDHELITYFASLLKSLYELYGYENAISFFNETIDKLEGDTELNVIWIPFWTDILRAELAVLEGIPLQVVFYLNRAYEIYHQHQIEGTEFLLHWIEKVYLDYLVMKGEVTEDIIPRYIELYNLLEPSKLHFVSKIRLLDDIVNQTLELGDYSLGYSAMNTRLNLNRDNMPNLNKLNLSQIYNETTQERQTKEITGKYILIITILGATLGIILIIHHIILDCKRMKELMSKSTIRKDLDYLTHTLTMATLYEKIEFDLEEQQSFTFIAVRYDDLQRYNEVYGYLNGDYVTKKLAIRLQSIFNDDYIARNPGQFFIIVSRNSKEECIIKVKTLIKIIYQLNIVNKLDLIDGRMTVSAGLSSGMIHSKEDIDQMIHTASHNLGISQKRGKNNFTI